MKRTVIFYSVLGLLLLASCSKNSSNIDTEPDVAITRIDGPLLSTQQAPESGGSGSSGINYDGSNLLSPGAGPITIAASSLYDPVTGQTAQNPLSVYVVASDETNVEQVELFQDSTAIGTRTKAEDGIAFKNPFIFPKPGSAQSSVTLQGSQSGLLSTQLRAVATDSSGQVAESAPLELQVDGSRPDLSFSVTGDGPPFSSNDLVTVTGSASDPETGISSFDVTLNGVTIQADASNSFSVSQTLSAGTQTLLLTAVNGVMVPNQLTYTFLVEEAPTEPGSGGEDNQAPVVNLTGIPRDTDPLIVDFTASASDPDNDGLTYTYDFGDGTTEEGAPTTSHTYTSADTYTVTVTVDDGNGGTASDSIVVPVGSSSGGGNGGGTDNQAPSVSLEATPTSGSAPLTVNLTATATDPDGDTLTYTWNFGDGETTEGSNTQSHTYDEAKPDSYTATVTVNDGNGGTVSATMDITVGTEDGGSGGNGGSQDPDVSIDGAEARTFTVGEAQDLAASVSNLGDDVTYQWSVTDGTAANVSFEDATAKDTTVTFSAADSYTLTLTASDGTNTVTDTVTFTEDADSGGNDGGSGGNDDNGGVDAVDDAAKTTKNKAVTIRVLTNDKPGVEALSIIAVTSPKQGGTVEISRDSRTIVYTPPEGFTGTDSFRYTVKDEEGNSAAAYVSVKVNP